MPIDLKSRSDLEPYLIDRFDGPHRWLSNFHQGPVTWSGHTFVSAEAAFAAGKTLDPELRAVIAAEHGTRIAISGGAVGSDLWWADVASDAGLKVWLYQPFPQQPDRWTTEWQQHHRRVRERSARVAVLSTRPKLLSETFG
jgi:hypothetical protein